MAHHIVELIAQYGLLLVFINVLVEQAGAPLPAVPTMMVAGALAAADRLPLAGVLGVAVLACLLADFAWYAAGRYYGGGVMRTLCRISLSPDSCVKQSELRFQRWRGGMLLLAKFVPGLPRWRPRWWVRWAAGCAVRVVRWSGFAAMGWRRGHPWLCVLQPDRRCAAGAGQRWQHRLDVAGLPVGALYRCQMVAASPLAEDVAHGAHHGGRTQRRHHGRPHAGGGRCALGRRPDGGYPRTSRRAAGGRQQRRPHRPGGAHRQRTGDLLQLSESGISGRRGQGADGAGLYPGAPLAGWPGCLGSRRTSDPATGRG